MSEPLQRLAEQLRGERTPISDHVVEQSASSEARVSPPEMQDGLAYVVEAVREGYLLHYDEPRLLTGHDDDLALLTGDYLYALGIERLAKSGDTRAVGVLAELIGACAQLHAEGREDEAPGRWRDAVRAIDPAA